MTLDEAKLGARLRAISEYKHNCNCDFSLDSDARLHSAAMDLQHRKMAEYEAEAEASWVPDEIPLNTRPARKKKDPSNERHTSSGIAAVL